MKIGFYNSIVDNKHKLKNCCFITDSFKELKLKVSENDVIILASELSLWNVNSKDFIDLMEDFKLNVFIGNMNEQSKLINKFQVTILLANIDFIKNNRVRINKLLNANKDLSKLKLSDKQDSIVTGRPNIHSEEQLKYAAECKLKGYTYKQIDRELKISKMTLYRYMKKNNLIAE